MRQIQQGTFEQGVLVTADWLTHVQEEICHVIEERGISLDVTQQDQLYDAIQDLRDSLTPPLPWYNVTDYGAFPDPASNRVSLWAHWKGGMRPWAYQTVPRVTTPAGDTTDQAPFFALAFQAVHDSEQHYGMIIAPPGFYDFRTKLVIGDATTEYVRKMIFRGFNSSFRVWMDDHAVQVQEMPAGHTWPVMFRWERSFFVAVNTVHPYNTIFELSATLIADGPPTFRNVSGHFFDYENLYS